MAKARVTRDAWIGAAQHAVIRGGVAAVTVDALATELSITRGSFYWHFTDRDELLRAVLAQWERGATEAVIEQLARVADPRARLRALFETAIADPTLDGFEVAICADAGNPAVAPVLARVTQRRLAFLAQLYQDTGSSPAAARHRAVTAYAAYIGWISLRRTSVAQVPEVAPTGTAARAALDHLIDTLS